MRVRIAFVCVVVALFSAACGEDDPAPPVTTPPTPVASEAPSQTATPPASAPAGPTTVDAAALGLYNAWLDGDSEAAAAFATPQAINELFAHPGSEVQFNSCSQVGSKYRCFFYYEGGGLNMDVEGNATSGFRVIKAFFIAD